jgi:hypothetical protein
VNKRQRKKRVTKMKRYIENFLRESLKPFIGAPITPEAKARMETFMTSVMLPVPQPGITATFILTPSLAPPYRQWRKLGAYELTHHVGQSAVTLGGLGPWRRFCDMENVENEYVLSQAEMVNCLGCLAREDSFLNAQTDLNTVP